MFVNIKSLLAAHTPQPVIRKAKSPTASMSSSPKDSPKKRPVSPSTSEVTASPPQSPAHPPTTLAISKNVPSKSPNLSPASPRSPHLTKPGAKGHKTPTKSPGGVAKSPKKSSS